MVQDNHGPDTLYLPIVSLPKQKLTEDQDHFVMELFGKYIREDFSAEDASEIIDALEDAGIRGPQVRSSVVTAGLDAQKFIDQVSIKADAQA
ncbi:hypothetical protein FDZ74_11855 [bacterium]|nr:MAG: hypothetical protein FDZ74_11855 [bacterium]